MGTGYVRNDSGNNIADGNVINASDLDGEFDAIAATLATGGHTHDGTAAEGGPITKVGPSQDLVVTASLVNPKTDNTLDLGTASLEFKDLFIDGTAHIDTLDVDESGAIAADLTVGDDLSLVSDGSILGFGTNTEVTLTHVHDTGLLLNSTMALQFNDASQFIKGASNAILAIGATDEVDLTATLFDVNANLDVSGTALITGVLTATEAAVFNGGFTSNADTNTFTSANSTDPRIIIKNTTNDTNAAVLSFVKDKGAAGADDDSIGSIFFTGDNDAQEQTLFARINGVVQTAADGQEGGKIQLQVATHDGEKKTGLEVFDGSAEDEIDVNIGFGTASLTTIAGTLTSTGPITAAGGAGSYNNTANVLTLNGTQHTRLLIDTASTAGHVAGLSLESNGQITSFTNNGSTSAIVNDIGDFTIDSAADITLDAGGSDILLKVAGTTFGSLRENASNFRIKSDVSDKDMLFLGNDGGAEITALTLDMSSVGDATFNGNVKLADDRGFIMGANSDFQLYHDPDVNIIQAAVSDQNIRFKINDGGTVRTCLDFNAANGGRAEFQQQTTAQVARFINTVGDSIIQIDANAANKNSIIHFGDGDDADVGKIDYDHNTNDFAFITNASEKVRITSSGNVGIFGNNPITPSAVADSTGVANLQLSGTFITHFDTDAKGTSAFSNNKFWDGSNNKALFAGQGSEIQLNSGTIKFRTGANVSAGANITMVEYMRLSLDGNLLVGETTAGDVTNGTGVYIAAANGQFYASSSSSHFFNKNADGDVLVFRSAGNTEGSVSISGSTTSYNAFSGSHWSRLSDNSKPTILKGTVMEPIDTMVDWYQAQFTVAARTEVNGDGETVEVKASYVSRDSIALPSGASVGDTITHTSNGITYDNAVIILEGDNKHPKCKISDTADSTRVYGVFADWNQDVLGGVEVNDMYITAVGTHVVRVHGGQTVAGGDLLVSNGDGTAKVQDDDIIRSKTLGKVLTNIKQETYADDSYTVPCALYCG